MRVKPDAAPAAPLPARVLALVGGRGISGLGSAMTVFGLDVWVLRQTGSFETFAYLALLAALPNLLLAPLAGLMVDRCNKKSLLLGCELAKLAALAWVVWRYQAGALDTAAVALAIVLMATAASVRWMAMGVALPLLVPAAALGRVNALQQAFQGVSTVAGPLLGAAGVELLGLGTLLLLDAGACLVALAGMGAVSAHSLRVRAPLAAYPGWWQEVSFGFRWVAGHPGLLRLMLFFMVFNLGVSVFSVAFTPYVLGRGSSTLLGAALACQGAGAVVAGLLLTAWRAPLPPASRVLGGAALFGAMMLAWGMSRATPALLVLSASAGALTTLIVAASQTIWQTNVPAPIRGKVFAARMVVSFSLGPLAILASVPAARHLCEPLLGSVAWAARLWGEGQSGALGMLVSVLGGATVLGCCWLWRRGGLAVEPGAIAAQPA